MTTLHLSKSLGRSPLRRGLPRVQRIWIIRGFLLIPLLLACFGLSPQARAGACQAGCLSNFNTALGFDVLISNTTGAYNVAIGEEALYSNTTGGDNTANGFIALSENTTGSYNTATGSNALRRNTTASGNTANGNNALSHNTTGIFNTATGFNALYSNTTGVVNTANGVGALYSNTTGFQNTASGYNALGTNTAGYQNTANGASALHNNATGNNNTATGVAALYYNTIGSNNTANGYYALVNNTTAGNNTAEGFQALLRNTGANNIGLGYNAGSSLTTGSGNVCIGVGVLGVAGESSTTRIKNVYASVASGRAVYVNSDNKIGTLVSSRRFKDEIKLMDKASEAILALKPVTFRYEKEIEPNGGIMFGLIAEEVEKVAPDLVTRDSKGEAETVRYDAVNAMLLNEFLKERRKVEEQQATITQLKNYFGGTIAELTARLDEQAAQIQKVSARLEASKPAPQVVNNP